METPEIEIFEEIDLSESNSEFSKVDKEETATQKSYSILPSVDMSIASRGTIDSYVQLDIEELGDVPLENSNEKNAFAGFKNTFMQGL